jgi:hypothetical protein
MKPIFEMSIRKTGGVLQPGVKQSRYIDTDEDEIEIGDLPEENEEECDFERQEDDMT